MSQGGLNASLLLFKRPELWSGAVMSCPALYDLDLFAPKDQIAAYAHQHGFRLSRLQYGMDLVLNRVANSQEWKRENPLIRAAGKLSSPLPPIFVECNREDEFGFCGGARQFVKILAARGRRIEFQEDPGDHCAIDPEAPSRFIARLQERSAESILR
jgi:pimeloyl-ACP methyl ester carboxylesterase